MKFLAFTFNGKASLFELSRNVGQLESFELNGYNYILFDKIIYADPETGKGRTKKPEIEQYPLWVEIVPDIFILVTTVYKGNTSITKENLKSFNMDQTRKEMQDILSNLEEYNENKDIEIGQRKDKLKEKREIDKQIKKEKEEKEVKDFENRINKSLESYKLGREIDAEAFEELLKRNKIEIPLRTLGWIRKNIIMVKKMGTQRFYGRKPSETVRVLIQKLNNALCLN